MLFQQCNQVKWFKLQEANTWSSLHNEPSVLLRFLRKRRKVARDELPQDFTPPTNFSPLALAPRSSPLAWESRKRQGVLCSLSLAKFIRSATIYAWSRHNDILTRFEESYIVAKNKS